MVEPGRQFTAATSTGYRFGFNGKEKSDEIEGNGVDYDYGFRIYDARIGRFLSVDPITNNYPMLTPFQFASDRPIDGKDIDGLEYGTIHVTVNVNTSETSSLYVPYDATQLNVNGPLGRGVNYSIVLYEATPHGSVVVSRNNFFYKRNAMVVLGTTHAEYGNYMGATSFYNVNKYGSFNNGDNGSPKQYVYPAPAVDAVDQAAKMHDIGYDKLGAEGESSLFDDWGTTPVDESALNTWNNFLGNYKTGDKDPLTGQKITRDEMHAASNAASLFNITTNSKKYQLALTMREYFPQEAKSPGSTKYPNPKSISFNYNLFLQKYMTKDKDGNWQRKANMWTKNEDGNWKPNKPK